MAQRERIQRRALKRALIDAEMRQQDLVRITNIESSTISRIINGVYPGTQEQHKAIAKALLRAVEDLFPEEALVS